MSLFIEKLSEMFLKFKSKNYVSADEIINNYDNATIRKKVEYTLTGKDTSVSLETLFVQITPELNDSKVDLKYYKNIFNFLSMLMNKVDPPPADYVKTMFVNMKGESNVWIKGLLAYIMKNSKKLKISPEEILQLRKGIDNPQVATIKQVIDRIKSIVNA